MTMEIGWLTLLGFLLAGYFVLGGYDYGVQMIRLLLYSDETSRRMTLRSFGPFFLGNEVWLVAFTGVLFGAFPVFEGTLLSGLYPVIVAILAGLVLGNAAVQLRNRATSPTGVRIWDALVAVGGVVPAVSWGLVVGVLLSGVPSTSEESFTLTVTALTRPFVVLCGVLALLLFAAHGAAFLTMRMDGPRAERARQAAKPLVLGTLGALIGTCAVVVLAGDALAIVDRSAVGGVAAAFAMALVLAWLALRGNRPGAGFAATCFATTLPVLAVGAGQFPYLLVSSVSHQFNVTLERGAADDATLTVLTGFGIVLIPVILGYQVWSWWLYRGRVDQHDLGYF